MDAVHQEGTSLLITSSFLSKLREPFHKVNSYDMERQMLCLEPTHVTRMKFQKYFRRSLSQKYLSIVITIPVNDEA